MKGRIALLVCVLGPVTALADDASVTHMSFVVPAGFTEVGGGPAMAEKMNARPNVTSADAHIYESSDGAVRLMKVDFTYDQKRAVGWPDLEDTDKQLADDLTGKFKAKTTSASSNREGSLLVAETAGDLADRHFVLRRVYGADSHKRIFAGWTMCIGAEEQLGGCANALKSMHLNIADQIVPAAKSSSKDERDDAIWGLATIVLLGLGIGVIGLRSSGRGPKWLRKHI